MLVLSRRIQERVVVAEEIEVVVLRVEGERVVLGFQAPKEIGIRRSEIPARSPRPALLAGTGPG